MQYVVFGIMSGGFLLLATLGFALVSRVERFLNIAHAEFISVGALGTWWLQDRGLHFILAAALAVVGTAVVALLTARLVYDPILKRGPAILLISSVGVVFVLHGVVEALVGSGIRTFDLPRVSNWDVGSVKVNPYQFGIVVASLVALVLLHLFLNRSTVGAEVRALADDRELALLRGIDVRRATRYVWLISGALAGLAGVALGMLGTLTADLGFEQILLILSVSIVAGLGSIYAVAIAAFGLGLAMDVLVQWIPPGYRGAVAFAAVIVVLRFLPQGIAGKART